MKTIDDIISDVIAAEGGYVDNPNDPGGKTKYGITEKVARQAGYTGDMRDLPEAVAHKIYFERYVVEPGFLPVMGISTAIAAELVDTGVNMGPGQAIEFLQRTLNAFNGQGTLWPDLLIDKLCGPTTRAALESCLQKRGKQDAERVVLRALNALQGARYIQLAEARKQSEDFVFGWLRNRVVI